MHIHAGSLILGLFVGAVAAFTCISLCVAAGNADREQDLNHLAELRREGLI